MILPDHQRIILSPLLHRNQQRNQLLQEEHAVTWATVTKWKPEKDELQAGIGAIGAIGAATRGLRSRSQQQFGFIVTSMSFPMMHFYIWH